MTRPKANISTRLCLACFFPSQERLLSYGIDLQVLVDATKNTSTNAQQIG
jgi:hypothetical protein